MAQLANAGGDTLTLLAFLALIGGAALMAVVNPTVRAGARDILDGMRDNAVGRFFYGAPRDDSHDAKPDNPEEKSTTLTEEVDTFDYDIYEQANPIQDP